MFTRSRNSALVSGGSSDPEGCEVKSHNWQTETPLTSNLYPFILSLNSLFELKLYKDAGFFNPSIAQIRLLPGWDFIVQHLFKI